MHGVVFAAAAGAPAPAAYAITADLSTAGDGLVTPLGGGRRRLCRRCRPTEGPLAATHLVGARRWAVVAAAFAAAAEGRSLLWRRLVLWARAQRREAALAAATPTERQLLDAAIQVHLLHLPDAGRPALLGVPVPLLDSGAFRTVGGGRAPVVR